MKKQNKPEFIFNNSKGFLLYIGLSIILIFFLIYIFVAIKTQKLDYFSFFFNNIIDHIFFTILTGFHVAVLGIGLLIILIVFFQTSIQIYCFNNRFEIHLFLQKKKTIYFNEIKDLNINSYQCNNKSFFTSSSHKECRIFFINPIYNFCLSYKIEGYFDNLLLDNKEEKREFLLRKCYAHKNEILSILNNLNKYYKTKNIYLPNEFLDN